LSLAMTAPFHIEDDCLRLCRANPDWAAHFVTTIVNSIS
jgi:hypothetical protein